MGKKSNKVKLKILFVLITCMLFAPYAYATVEVVDTKDLPKTKVLKRTTDILIEKRLQDNGTFDLRETIEIPIKDQKTTSQCWAFATNTVLETHLALRNNEKYDFSERHIIYSTTKSFTDGINEVGHNRTPAGGGNELIALAYYTSGRGPVPEEEMPFSTSEAPIALSEIKGKTVQKQVTDYTIFPSIIKSKDANGNIVCTDANGKTVYAESEVIQIRNSIKNHIMTYGAVVAMTLSGSGYNDYYNYQLDYPAYYCDNPEYVPNHQVVIIGWDDGYAIENFNRDNRPKKPGAYLVMNSYGTNQYKYGCYYISYEDCFVEGAVLGILNVKDIDYDNIYQYDPLGQSTNICIEGQIELFGANVFSKDKTTIEVLNEVSISSSVEQSFELYINPKNENLEQIQKVETEQVTMRAGYTTIKLKTPIELTNEKFVIAIKCIGQNQNAYIGIEARSTDFWLTATSNEEESYYSVDGQNWRDIAEELEHTNICIKAFTKIKEYKIISDSYTVEEEIIYRVLPKTKMEIFKNNIQSSADIKILKDSMELQAEDIVTTNTIVQVGENKTYRIIVTGDITGTGEISSTDISKLRMHLVGTELLNEEKQKAADMNNTGSVTLTDLSQMKSALIGLINV